jgi:hypothetical protein
MISTLKENLFSPAILCRAIQPSRQIRISSYIRVIIYTVYCLSVCCQSFLRVIATDNSICEQSINFTLKQDNLKMEKGSAPPMDFDQHQQVNILLRRV